MFTGIVEEAGQVIAADKQPKGIRLTLASRLTGKGARPGDSIAVNGCCLTVVRAHGSATRRRLTFDLLEETWTRTNLQYVLPGALVNLERSLRADDRLGGHFVTGHIDGIGRITRWERKGADWLLEIEPPPELMPYLIFKGSIAVDGISLTLAEVSRTRFRIWIIPHTFQVTNLAQRAVGDAVNLEPDILGKYVEQFLKLRAPNPVLESKANPARRARKY